MESVCPSCKGRVGTGLRYQKAIRSKSHASGLQGGDAPGERVVCESEPVEVGDSPRNATFAPPGMTFRCIAKRMALSVPANPPGSEEGSLGSSQWIPRVPVCANAVHQNVQALSKGFRHRFSNGCQRYRCQAAMGHAATFGKRDCLSIFSTFTSPASQLGKRSTY